MSSGIVLQNVVWQVNPHSEQDSQSPGMEAAWVTTTLPNLNPQFSPFLPTSPDPELPALLAWARSCVPLSNLVIILSVENLFTS